MTQIWALMLTLTRGMVQREDLKGREGVREIEPGNYMLTG